VVRPRRGRRGDVVGTGPECVGTLRVVTADVEITPSRESLVGQQRVRRALPHRARRTVGAWCFIDHMGPTDVTEAGMVGIGPHPHTGLQTVTWLTAGELLHRDTVGSEQTIRPGQLNLMTAGHGVAHAEEPTTYHGRVHGVQFWVAQPERTRRGVPAFEHHPELPQLDLDGAVATVLVGSLGGTASPARRDTDHVGIDLRLRPGTTVVPLERTHEHALVVLEGAVEVRSGDAGTIVEPGHLAYLGSDRDELALASRDDTSAVLVGGVPFESPVLMWWNFVARTHDEIDAAQREWNDRAERFGEIASTLDRIPAPTPPWVALGRDR
jgi:redox-sensitive bicupin YhaK (pirin superfamily)